MDEVFNTNPHTADQLMFCKLVCIISVVHFHYVSHCTAFTFNVTGVLHNTHTLKDFSVSLQQLYNVLLYFLTGYHGNHA
jgi:hypothetical protein